MVRVPVHGPDVQNGAGNSVYATDGVTNNAQAHGMVVYRTILERPGNPKQVDHLNPQTMG